MKTRISIIAIILAVATSCATTSIENTGFNGLYFSTANVIEEFEVGETAHYIIYDDADAGMDNEVIRLTSDTYYKVIETIKNGGELSGDLHPVKNNETTEYAL